jgi:hypothetical protein
MSFDTKGVRRVMEDVPGTVSDDEMRDACDEIDALRARVQKMREALNKRLVRIEQARLAFSASSRRPGGDDWILIEDSRLTSPETAKWAGMMRKEKEEIEKALATPPSPEAPADQTEGKRIQIACDKCSQGSMDADGPSGPGNDHLYGRCKCDCHQTEGKEKI